MGTPLCNRRSGVADRCARVDALYSFFIQWSPNVSGDGEFDVNDRGFVVLGSADSGATKTDAAEPRSTNYPASKWHVS